MKESFVFEKIIDSFKSTPDQLLIWNESVQTMFKNDPALYIPEHGDINGVIPCVNIRVGINPPVKYNPKKLPCDWRCSKDTLLSVDNYSYNTLYTPGTIVLKFEWYLCNTEMIPVPIDPNGCKYLEDVFEVTPSIWNRLKKCIRQYTLQSADAYIEVDSNKIYLYNYDLSEIVEYWNIFSVYKFNEENPISKDALMLNVLAERNMVSSISYDKLKKFLISYIEKQVTIPHLQYMYSIDSNVLKVGECEEVFSLLFTLYFNQK